MSGFVTRAAAVIICSFDVACSAAIAAVSMTLTSERIVRRTGCSLLAWASDLAVNQSTARVCNESL
jgi:hypothetical protein